jgi:hypothetical protein
VMPMPSMKTTSLRFEEQLRKTMPPETTAAGVTPIDAIVGPLFDTSLHEFAHALFEMLRVPVLGREEDAADQVSAYIMLQLGKVEARRLIETSASELRRNPITGTAACCARFPAFRCRVPPGP